MTSYHYPEAFTDLSRLQAEISAAALPVSHINSGAGGIDVFMTRDLTPAEQTQLDSLVAAYDGRPRRTRPLYSIYSDINALTGAQKTAMGADLFSGSPNKVVLDTAPNAAAIASVWLQVQFTSLSLADRNLAKLMAATMYTQDQPLYLVHPTWDTSVNIPGDEPVEA